ncbi:hypothetical protein JOF56_001132 [Kibdelosporangium banguiense]|uniref:Uncharacterized protein n=1 Tax=Kibdelosporangium banguiense TaxID=1365924 RepID=A0ABS4T8J7_9PSEU|nr:hypothetical protein [Kibdelosporangium banguiense]MBP2320747.1 hypothetical protein [Kibdelosporangium banguiense]
MRIRSWAVLAIGSCVLAAGCGASEAGPQVASVSTPGSASSGPARPGDPNKDPFSECMRQQGVEPRSVDDSAGGGGSGQDQAGQPPAGDQRKRQEALDKCRQFLPDGGQPKPMSAEALEQARQFAKCMRGLGVAYPDPDPNVGGGAGTAPIPKEVDITDPAVRQKLNKCSAETQGSSTGPTR